MNIECVRCEYFEVCPSTENNLPCPSDDNLRRLEKGRYYVWMKINQRKGIEQDKIW